MHIVNARRGLRGVVCPHASLLVLLVLLLLLLLQFLTYDYDHNITEIIASLKADKVTRPLANSAATGSRFGPLKALGSASYPPLKICKLCTC
jgi:hypothetical protein